MLVEKNRKLLEDKKDDKKHYLSLLTFLACLDSHILSERNIIIMTTNHIDYLDPACIWPDWIDLHLEFGYYTQYQISKLFKSVIIYQSLRHAWKNSQKDPWKIITFLWSNDDIDFVSKR